MLINENIKFKVLYSFCISKFLKDKFESKQQKYVNIKKIMKDDNIEIFYGSDKNYFDVVYDWIIKIL